MKETQLLSNWCAGNLTCLCHFICDAESFSVPFYIHSFIQQMFIDLLGVGCCCQRRRYSREQKQGNLPRLHRKVKPPGSRPTMPDV